MQKILKMFADKKGATAIEYGLIAALIAVAAIAAMSGLGESLRSTFDTTATALDTGVTTGGNGGGSTGGGSTGGGSTGGGTTAP